MSFFTPRLSSAACAAVVAFFALASTAVAQLEVTEVMFDPNDDGVWEWFEIRNNSGSAVDLNGAYIAKLGGADVGDPAIDGSATNTVVPSNGLAVIYNADLGFGNPANFDDQVFRDAWGLGSGVALIGAANLPALSNSGSLRNFALWANQVDYAANLTLNAETNNFEVTSLNNSLLSIDYASTNGFPAGNNSASIRWSGNGNYQDGANWALSEIGQTGVATSSEITVSGSTNSTLDIGNPGVVPAGAAAGGLLVTEIMYNPRSPEGSAEWEWVEIYNNTGAEVNFATTPYVLDDDDGAAIGAANIASGSIGNGSTAILFNADQIGLLDVQAAWDAVGNGTNFIGVPDWPGFANGGDLVALWDVSDQAKFDLYTADRDADVATNAELAILYDDDPLDLVDPWPADDGNGSIYLADLSADPNVGANWVLSPSGSVTSFNAAELTGSVTIHPGGDVGSPGSFEVLTVADVDLDNDGDIDGADFLLIQQTNPALIPDWQAQYPGSGSLAAAAVPEPASVALCGLAVVCLPLVRRK